MGINTDNTLLDQAPMKVTSLVILCAILSGCSFALRPYVHPDNEPYAYFKSGYDLKHDNVNNIAIYEKAPSCEGRHFIALQDKSINFYRIPAERNLSVTVGYSPAYRTHCNTTLRFTPVQGKYYWAIYNYKDNKCYAGLLASETSDFAKYETVDFEPMKFSTAMDENGSWCNPIKK